MPSATDLLRQRDRLRGAGAGIPSPLAAVPDDELIACQVALGVPRWSAEILRRDPMARLHALRLWVDVGDAAKGDPRARERVDLVRESVARMRAAELITDDPRGGYARDHLVDPADLL